MKKTFCLAVMSLAIHLTSVIGQPVMPVPNRPGRPMMPFNAGPQASQSGDQSHLTRFNLNFPGGSPRDLVAAITNATGRPLNVIISDEDNNSVRLPELMMDNVNAPQLFSALMSASIKQFQPQAGPYYNSSYGFSAPNQNFSDDTIWYFHVDKPAESQVQEQIRFYSLAPYLDRGLTVDDITTAIQTGWKMAGFKPAPDLNYHKETKLLIAYGEPHELDIIQSVLSSLPASNSKEAGLDRRVKMLEEKMNLLEKRESSKPQPAPASPEKPGK